MSTGRRGAREGVDLGGRKAFVVVTPGLEELLVEELTSLGLEATLTTGGAYVPASWASLERIHTWSAVAAAVRVRLARVNAGTLEELAHGIKAVPWANFVQPRQPLEVDVSSYESRLRRKSAVERKVQLAVGDALRGPRLNANTPGRLLPAELHLRIEQDRAEVSIDASGELLHRRGWRERTAKAPIRENLAAAILRLAKWQPGETLVDPMCGSGTFAIEAARRAAGKPPRLDRQYAWERFPAAPKRVARSALPWTAVRTRILAADRDPGAMEATSANARHAGMALDLRHTPLQELEPPGPTGLLVCNLPYGHRIADVERLEGLYKTIGGTLRAHWGGWRLALVVPEHVDASVLHGGMSKVARFLNGGIPIGLWCGTLRPKAE
jgi:putative N6-adenine-specific DNA methylase